MHTTLGVPCVERRIASKGGVETEARNARKGKTMGGRNTYAAGKNVPFVYKTVGVFHAEPDLTGHHKPVYHIHEYGSDFSRSDPRLLTPAEIQKYGKYLTKEGCFK